MTATKQRRRIGYGPMGTPGMGPGQHHRAAAGASGRLGRAMRSLAKGSAAPNSAPKTATRAVSAVLVKGGGGKASGTPSKPSPAKKCSGKAGPPARTTSAQTRRSPNPAKQLRANTTAKLARKKEAGLTVGRVSAGFKRAQARRDSNH